MRLAILGASSRIASDFVRGLSADQVSSTTLFARDPKRAASLTGFDLDKVLPYSNFGTQVAYDGIINFVGQSTPESRESQANDIRHVNNKFDMLALSYLDTNPNARYVYLSSGAALGSSFAEPAMSDSPYLTENLDEYSKAKQESELRHRDAEQHNVVDLRIFSYFHRTQPQESRFLMSNIVKAIRSGEPLEVDSTNIWRDYLSAEDFSQLMFALLSTSLRNVAIDAFTAAPISKFELLDACANQFNLQYVVRPHTSATGTARIKYYSEARTESLEYRPKRSSLENVVTEIGAILKGV